MVEPDTLESDHSDFQSTSGVELRDFISILRGCVFATFKGLFDDGLSCLNDVSVLEEGKSLERNLNRQGVPLLHGEIIQFESLIYASVVPYTVFDIETFCNSI